MNYENYLSTIGTGKTGTTSIQNFLAANYKGLLSSGINYVNAGQHHHMLAKSFITNIPDYMVPPHNVEKVRDSFRNEIEQCDEDVILISSENFPMADPVAVHSYFDDICSTYNFKIILFVRSQDELLESAYNQLVKIRPEKRSLSECADQEFQGDFMKLASAWEELFGHDNMICRIYDGGNLNVLTDFLNCLHVPVNMELDSRCDSPATSNRSL